MKPLILLLLPFGIFLTSGCSSFLYYPEKRELVYREKMPLKPEDVYFPSEDGAKIHAWYFHAPKDVPRRSCTILFFHGNGENLSTHFYYLYTAPERGYDYMIFDYHGYGESEGSPSPKSTVEDGRAALRYLHARSPQTPTVVFGQSLGGDVALRSVLDLKAEAAAHPDAGVPIQLVIVDSTFASYRSVGRAVMAHSWITWLFQPLGWLLLSDSEAPERDLGKLAPTPLIVIHGDKDQIVDYELGKKLYDEASQPKEFWPVAGGRHTSFMFMADRQYANRFYAALDHACPVEAHP